MQTQLPSTIRRWPTPPRPAPPPIRSTSDPRNRRAGRRRSSTSRSCRSTRPATSRPSTATATPTSPGPSRSRSATSTSRKKRPTRRWSVRTRAGTRSARTTIPAAGCTASASTGPAPPAAACHACVPFHERPRRRRDRHRSRELRGAPRPRRRPARRRRVPPAPRLVGRRDRRRAAHQTRHGEEPPAPRPRPTRTNPRRCIVNTDQLDQLRDALRREANDIEPVGLGVETVQRRGRRRRTAAAHRRGRRRDLRRRSRRGGDRTRRTRATLRRRGRATRRRRHADTRLPHRRPAPSRTRRRTSRARTASPTRCRPRPGTTGRLERLQPGDLPHERRRARGRRRPVARRGSPTSPSATASSTRSAPHRRADIDDVKYQLATSNNDGAAWTDTDLPFDLSAPSASVPMSRSSGVQIARGSDVDGRAAHRAVLARTSTR